MELSPICKKEYPALRALYRSAFPAAERMPLSRFFTLQKKGQAEILVLRTGGAFAGLMIVTFAHGYALLNYFAVEPDCRSMGLGSRALPALQQRYPNRQVVLEVEPPDHTAPNARQRQRRLDFYAKNGFLPCNLPVRLCGVALDVLTPGGQALDFAAYQGFYRPIFGRLAPLFVQKRQQNAAGPNSPCILAGGGVE